MLIAQVPVAIIARNPPNPYTIPGMLLYKKGDSEHLPSSLQSLVSRIILDKEKVLQLLICVLYSKKNDVLHIHLRVQCIY